MKWHSGKVLWFTGLSGSGKSTLSSMLKHLLTSRGVPVVLLDGDVLRDGLNRDLGFSADHRAENIRRAAEVAKILSDAGHTVLAAFITPLESLRQNIRGIFDPSRYVEIFVDCPLRVCEQRDPKGLYARARAGLIADFTGVSAPFDPPCDPGFVVRTSEESLEQSIAGLLQFLENRFPDLSREEPKNTRAFSYASRRRVAVVGLDGTPPSLLFDADPDELPNIRALVEHGVWGPLRSTDPPITVPAWTTMTTGKDPGELGLYGFRNRRDRSYGPMITAGSVHVRARRVWEILEDFDKTSILLGVPQTHPVRPHAGITVPGMLSPDVGSPTCFPPQISDDVLAVTKGRYRADVPDFRNQSREHLLEELYSLVRERFRVAREFIVNRSWDFFMMVEIATDRLHHAFWNRSTQEALRTDHGSEFNTAVRDFYRFLDAEIGSFAAFLDDETTLVIVSDHGSQEIAGAFHINEWLIAHGYLVLTDAVVGEVPLQEDIVDWSRTTAWAEGGVYARIFLNVRDREPRGIVDPDRYDEVRMKLARELESFTDETGLSRPNRVLFPERIYRDCTGIPPDLMVYFDDLRSRCIATVGTDTIRSEWPEDDPDRASHNLTGMIAAARMSNIRSGKKLGLRLNNAAVTDITPSILYELGATVPRDLSGHIIDFGGSADTRRVCEATGDGVEEHADNTETDIDGSFSTEEEELIRKRLSDLGHM